MSILDMQRRLPRSGVVLRCWMLTPSPSFYVGGGEGDDSRRLVKLPDPSRGCSVLFVSASRGAQSTVAGGVGTKLSAIFQVQKGRAKSKDPGSCCRSRIRSLEDAIRKN